MWQNVHFQHELHRQHPIKLHTQLHGLLKVVQKKKIFNLFPCCFLAVFPTWSWSKLTTSHPVVGVVNWCCSMIGISCGKKWCRSFLLVLVCPEFWHAASLLSLLSVSSLVSVSIVICLESFGILFGYVSGTFMCSNRFFCLISSSIFPSVSITVALISWVPCLIFFVDVQIALIYVAMLSKGSSAAAPNVASMLSKSLLTKASAAKGSVFVSCFKSFEFLSICVLLSKKRKYIPITEKL